jgi:hypothetical protein
VGPKLYWIEGPWSGRLAISARPRGGDWLEDEAKGWQSAGVEAVVSLLTPEEDAHFELSKEAQACAVHHIKFFGFPIPDRGVPTSLSDFEILISDVRELLKNGRNVAVHCRQGIGRSGMLAASLLAESGLAQQTAIENVSSARGLPVPETPQQTHWVLTLPTHAGSVTHRTRT